MTDTIAILTSITFASFLFVVGMLYAMVKRPKKPKVKPVEEIFENSDRCYSWYRDAKNVGNG